jgi:hypothetical protein
MLLTSDMAHNLIESQASQASPIPTHANTCTLARPHLSVLRACGAELLDRLLDRQPHLPVVAVAVARIELVAGRLQDHLPAGQQEQEGGLKF